MIRRISKKRLESSVRRNIRKRRFESVEDGWMCSIDDFYGLDFMDGNDSGYYSPKGTPHDSYASVECFIDDVDGSFGVLIEDVEVNGIVDSFFNTIHLDRKPLRRKSLSEFTDEDIQEFVENCITSGEFSHTERDAEVLWTERDNSWAYDDMIASLDACAREQEQKRLEAEWDACQFIKEELSMATETRNIRNPNISGRRNERRSRRFEGNGWVLNGKTGTISMDPLQIRLEDDTHVSVTCASFPFLFDQEEWSSTPPHGRGMVTLDDATGLIYALNDLDVIESIRGKVVYTKFTGSRLYFMPKDEFVSVTLKDGFIPRDERLQKLKEYWKELGCDVSDVERISCLHVPCKEGFSWINAWGDEVGRVDSDKNGFVIYTMMKLGLDKRNERRSRRF